MTEYVLLSAILFTIGCVGVLTRRNALVVFMCIELMLNAANLTFLAFARDRGDVNGHISAFFIIAVAAAEAALPAWRAAPAKVRADVLRRWFDLVVRHQEDLARLLTAEQGKPLAEARGEIAYAAGFIEWFAEEARRAVQAILALQPAWGADPHREIGKLINASRIADRLADDLAATGYLSGPDSPA